MKDKGDSVGDKALLSVIVPVYNVEKYLKRCINSIISQTYTNLQIILVNDGSLDSSGKICDEYTKKDSRIIAVHQKNEGLSGARNNGLLFAKGELISFVDSDDWLHPDMYKTLVQLLQMYNLDMARCAAIGTNGVDEKKILPHNGIGNKIITGKSIFDLYFNEFLCKVVWNAVYKKDIVQGILSPERCHSQDNYVSGRYLYRSNRMMITDMPLYYYFENPNSITHGGHKRFLDICLCTKKLRDDLIAEEGMNNPQYIKNLNRKLARELYHFVRANDSAYIVSGMNKELKYFIEKYLDMFRRVKFDILLHKKKIRLY